ncbi:acyl-CoA thioesterase [Leptospira sarikeiensis]|uniref:Acyl-CoA thioesterase n=1 Tax=Leptospira sarikeiensis TaxID=2484943 RepID=A0A4R9K622_9LEPT|nr:acyl-CoA thioesterase [Leptospira sarikeiensis]TGL60671.1 acyl-CoA thioesterase [Leptospira sarikeiensis]
MELTIQKPPLSPHSFARIRFQDCDPFGHLNNARYMDYFLEARSEHLRETGNFDFYEYGIQSGRSWVVNKVETQYLEPVKQNDIVKIVTRLTKLTQGTISNEYLLMDKDGSRLKALLWADFTYIDLNRGRPVRHEPEMMSFLGNFLYDELGLEETSFESRVKQLRKQITEGKYSQG